MSGGPRGMDAPGADRDDLTRAERIGVIVGVGLAALVTIVTGTLLALDGGPSHAVEPISRDAPAVEVTPGHVDDDPATPSQGD
ncbi:hypothetical protein GCM10027515_07120 [Schumannella luteola]|uniref:Uncharacterized protein n=1 Tax=Schumannella luteola TaxID=472059 RepID=A0A852YEN8_9MICO|nr:hypothetical protein [Schumannella luteola]NYG98157.1 hypothetical protein [Schumannella luteola]TPX01874.1 hypothetical protein FJ656_26180 [Schumannella luteola]